MKRRDFIKLTGCAMGSALAGKTGFASTTEAQKPNIIYILCDDLGYGDLSCYGQKKFKTPNIDKLAAEGMKFTQHYSGSTVCAPSRCSLMTGLHTGHAQVRGNRGVKPEGQAPMKRGTVTIPDLLKKAGYTTGMFGKWGLGAPESSSDPAGYFDEFFGYNCQGQAHTYYPKHLWHNREKVHLDGKTYSHDLIVNAAFDFIKVNRNTSFFCYMPVTIPHAAMHAPAEIHEKYRKLFPEHDDKIGRYSGPKVKNPIAAFAAMLTHLDDQVGDLMKLLKKLAIDKNTIVMFTSDNGPHREGGHDPGFWNSSGPLKGIKRSLHEGGIRVPMIARWPGRIAAGSTTDHISAFWDVMPTCTELAGADAPKDIDGISYVSTLLGKTDKQKQHKYLYWEFYERGGKQAIRKGKWKAIRKKVKKKRNGPIELYNLNDDPGETKNIAKENPETSAELIRLMKEAHVESSVFKW